MFPTRISFTQPFNAPVVPHLWQMHNLLMVNTYCIVQAVITPRLNFVHTKNRLLELKNVSASDRLGPYEIICGISIAAERRGQAISGIG
jgi:hypothetical protein